MPKKLKIFKLQYLLVLPVLLLGVFAFRHIRTIFAATSPWTQTDWSGGVAGGTVDDTVTTYTSATDVKVSTAGEISLDDSNARIAKVVGTLLSNDSTDLNSATSPTGMKYNTSQYYNDEYFSYDAGNPTRLVVDQDGDYFVSANLEVNTPGTKDGNRSAVEMRIRVNGILQDVGGGNSGYIRNDSEHYEASNSLAVLLEDLSADDFIEIFVERNTSLNLAMTGTLAVYAEHIDDSSETVFNATATETTYGTDLNQSSPYEMKWIEGRKDTGFTHSDISDSEDLTLDAAGKYLVAVNVPIASSIQRANIKGKVLLDGSQVIGAEFKQGYIRNGSSHNNSSIHWFGVVESTLPNQVLSVTVEREGLGGVVTLGGDKATLFVRKLPDTGIIQLTGTQVGGGDNWNPPAKSNINWDTQLIYDSTTFTHSTVSSNDEITVNEDGEYLIAFNASMSNSVTMRSNTKFVVQVNGLQQTELETSHNYIRDLSDHDEASSALLMAATELSAGDKITLSAVQEAATVTVNDTNPGTLVIWKKGLANTGEVVSNVFDSGNPSDWGVITFNSSGGGDVEVYARTDTDSDFSDAESWSSCTALTSGDDLADTDSICVSDLHQYIQYKVVLNADGLNTPVFEDISIAFEASDLVPPDVNASAAKMYTAVSGGRQVPEDDPLGNWNNSSTPYFTWTAGEDDALGNGLKGYCLYLGTDPDANPGNTGGILQNSPISTVGTNCGFIVSGINIDFSAGDYFTSPLASGTTYYLNIKAIDFGNNVFTGASEQVKFRHDSTAPTNVAYISAPSINYGSVDDMLFSWPETGGSASSDSNSQVLGWQYQINDTQIDGWKGTTTNTELDIDYIPLSGSSYDHNLNDAEDGGDIIVGDNIVYFRTVDNAGNSSSAATYRTALLSYGGAAPTFETSCALFSGVTVTPSTSTSNSFALSWDAATPQGEATLSTYYYMINTPPPAQTATLSSNSTSYVPTTSTSVSAQTLTGAVKGVNTVYVVAVDSEGQYSQSNCVKGQFTLDSSLPDAAQNLTAADSSIKSEEIWKASLTWDEPDYQGTGSLTYIVERSTDNSSWTEIGTTTGTSYTDTVPESTTYYYRLGAYDSTSESQASPTYTTSTSILPKGAFLEAPDISSEPSVTNLTTKRATITWSTSRTADSKISYGTSSGDYFDEEPSKSEQVTSHSIELTNLDPGQKYYYVVKFTDEDGNTGISDEYSFTTDPSPDVSAVRAENVSISSALIKFTISNSAQVTLQYGESTAYGGSLSVSTGADESEYTVNITGLQDDTVHHFRLIMEDSEGEEYFSDDYVFQTLPRPRISGVRVQQIKGTAQPAVLVTWNTNTEISSIVTYYPISSPSDARDEVNVSLVSGEHRMLIKGLLPTQRYSMVVKGRDKLGNEAISDPINFTTATDTRPPKIANLKIEGNIEALGSSGGSEGEQIAQLIVSWNTDEAATSQVEFGEGTGTSYSQLTQLDTNLKFNHVVIVTGLSPSKVYHLRALSSDEAGNQQQSIDTVTITPKANDNALDLVIGNLTEAFGFLGGFR